MAGRGETSITYNTHTERHKHTQTNRDKNVLLTKDAALRASVTFPAVCEEMEDISEGSDAQNFISDGQTNKVQSCP